MERDEPFFNCFATCYRLFSDTARVIELIAQVHKTYIARQEADPTTRNQNLRSVYTRLATLLPVFGRDLSDDDVPRLTRVVSDLLECAELKSAREVRSSLVSMVLDAQVRKAKAMQEKPVRPLSMLEVSSVQAEFLSCHAMAIAKQLTQLDSDLYAKIEVAELLIWARSQSRDLCPNIFNMITHFNRVSGWAATQVLRQLTVRARAKALSKLINVMKCLRKLHNFNSLMALLSSTNGSAVHRLSHSFEALSTKSKLSLDKLNELMTHERAFAM